jgi:hypothetical protein
MNLCSVLGAGMDKASRDFNSYRDEVAKHFASLRIGEPLALAEPEAAERTDERLAQCIWFDSLFLQEGLRTDSGLPLEILHPGRWNHDEGPDFKDAKIRIAGRELRGDIEIHIAAGGWRQHRHHFNPTYNSVVLHAYVRPEDTPRPACNSLGQPIEGFAMGPVLFPDIETIRQTIHVEDYPYQTPSASGRCQPLMCSLDEDYVAGMLDAAGRERLEAKTARFADQAQGETLDQVFYQAVMTSMGHGANKGLYFLLSKRAPLSEIADYLHDLGRERAVEFFQSVLLHVARLVPEDGAGAQPGSESDAETLDYLKRIREAWKTFSGYFADRLIPATRQWTTGVRPVNFAHRRLAGVAHLLARCFLDEGVAAHFTRRFETLDPALPDKDCRRWIRRKLIDAFVVGVPADFWAWRYTFSSRRSPGPMKLIGEGRAASIVLNALLPLLLLHARNLGDESGVGLEERVWRVFHAFPALESNAITRHMRVRLFGDHARGKDLLGFEARQQGLFHIFRACCNQNEKGCEDCHYVRRPQ